jgi:hypothetical protein
MNARRPDPEFQLDCRKDDSLPRLAWCASLTRGSPKVTVRHGAWIETRHDRFFEGVWDGDFGDGGFDRTSAFAGSGAVAGRSEITFVASMNRFEWLYVLRDGDRLLVSNSLVFALVEAGDAPDPAHPYYYRDILGIFRNGVTRPERAWLPTRGGRRLGLHAGVKLRVAPDLSIAREVVPQPAEPADYQAYVRLMQGTLDRTLANAADPRRSRPYRPVVSLSAGYDSPAVAVLAALAGCREAFTFADVKGQGDADNGKAIGERLGLQVTVYDHLAYLRLPSVREASAEAALCDWGWNVPFAAAEEQLTGGLMLSGRHGGNVWRMAPVYPDARVPWTGTTAGGSMHEYRLRAGFAHMAVPGVLSLDARPLRRIGRSLEMRPWSIGGDYDRPIPRRIVEEAGVPRGWFARKKTNAVVHPFSPLDGSRPGHAELRSFVDGLPADRLRDWKFRAFHQAYRLDAYLTETAERALRRFHPDVRLYPSLHPRWRKPPQPAAWAFHWGFDTLRCRYLPPR